MKLEILDGALKAAMKDLPLKRAFHEPAVPLMLYTLCDEWIIC